MTYLSNVALKYSPLKKGKKENTLYNISPFTHRFPDGPIFNNTVGPPKKNQEISTSQHSLSCSHRNEASVKILRANYDDVGGAFARRLLLPRCRPAHLVAAKRELNFN